jgi:hypothetical protein
MHCKESTKKIIQPYLPKGKERMIKVHQTVTATTTPNNNVKILRIEAEDANVGSLETKRIKKK